VADIRWIITTGDQPVGIARTARRKGDVDHGW
jgi:hypothetical protein